MNYTLLIFGCLFLVASFFLNTPKEKVSVVLLFLGACCFGLFTATIDSFLNTWDEQFHALVAKNVATNSCVPMLFTNPSLDYDYKVWTNNSVWLHKQPLFIWQMALSIKLFGVSEIAVRLPSVIMHAFTSVFIFYIGKTMLNKTIGIVSAILFSVSFYQLELIAGKYATDHNDVAFLFYCTGSFWAWVNFVKTNNKYWLVLIGIFSGGAVLTKWLMGLLVYIIWLITDLFIARKHFFKNLLNGCISGTVALVIFLPWQLYILDQFPNEALHEYNYNSLHLYQEVEEHTGGWLFHFKQGINELYGDGIVVPVALLLGIIVAHKKILEPRFKLFFLLSISFVYVFFTVVATKMLSYTIIVSPFLVIALGTLIYYGVFFVKKHQPIVLFLVVTTVAFGFFNFKKIKHFHHPSKNTAKLEEKQCIDSLANVLDDKNYVVFNFAHTPYANISAMFYTNYECYQHIPSQQEIQQIKALKKKVACIATEHLPNYIKNDTSVLKIESKF